MTLYELLGIDKSATPAQIKAAHKKMVRTAHPDSGGDAEKFRQVQEAFETLSDPERRARYDKTGRTDKSPVTPDAVKRYIDQMMRAAVDAVAADGSTDNPILENIREKLILTLQKSRVQIKDQKFQAYRKLERATRLLERFKPQQGFDPVGDALRDNVRRLQGEINQLDDAMELSQHVDAVLRTYIYEVGPRSEGQNNPGPTARSRGPIGITFLG